MFRIRVDEQIELALIGHQHAQPLYEIIDQNREFLERWLPWVDNTKAVSDTEAFIRSSLHDYADGKSMTCVIEYNQVAVGVISYNSINHNLAKVEVGYWLAAKYNGKGIVTRCCQFLIHYAFESLAMQKVQIAAAEENIASRAVIERLGFTLEGIVSRAESINGRVVDHAVYGLSKPG